MFFPYLYFFHLFTFVSLSVEALSKWGLLLKEFVPRGAGRWLNEMTYLFLMKVHLFTVKKFISNYHTFLKFWDTQSLKYS